ncbi:hypothetical protein QYF61_013031 [Mycteria americana]|uniref:SUEL-type lectin domain-containing protein n=1 Tax=Mycteria americana TaxID=33587 RepID=A0AAN7PJB3_MYCAM|nr:hypothetical protein QYF61_013031 [Mycteria americana]
MSMSLSYRGIQNWTQHSRWISPVLRGRLTSLDLLALPANVDLLPGCHNPQLDNSILELLLTHNDLQPKIFITESRNHLGWKRPLRSSSPTVNLTLPSPPLNHVPKHLIQTSFKYLQGWRLNHFPGQPVPMLDNPFSEVKFPNLQSKPPLVQLEAISSCPITCYLGEETDPHLSTTSFQVVVESNKVSPQPPFLRAKQPQFPQPLPIRLVLQTLHQLRCPSLDTLQPLNVSLVVGGPKLNTVFEAAFQPLFPKPVALHGIVVTQVQDLALGLVKPHTIGPSPSIQPVQVALQSLPPLKQINAPAQLGVVYKLTEAPAVPTALSTVAYLLPGPVEEARMALPFSSLSPFDYPLGGDTEMLFFSVSCVYPRLQKMLDECQDRRSCQFLVNSRLFGADPCPGTGKYLIVWYKCRPTKAFANAELTPSAADTKNCYVVTFARLNLTPKFSTSSPRAAQEDREWGLRSVHHTLSLPLLPPQGEDSSHSSPAPAWGPSHGRQSSMNFSNMSPSHGLQFCMNCSSMGPFHGVQSFRNRLLQCGSPTGPARSLLQHRLPMGSQPPLGIHLLQHGFLRGLQVDICSTMDLHGLQVDIYSTINPHGLQGTACLTMVFTRGCLGISAPEPGAPPPPPSSLALKAVSSIHEYKSKVACEDDKLRLSCKKSMVIAIYSAIFGRTQGGSLECPYQNLGMPVIGKQGNGLTEHIDLGRGWRLNHFPGQPVPMLDNPLGEVKFPNIQSKPPLAQLEAISSHPMACYLGEETDPHLSTTSFQKKDQWVSGHKKLNMSQRCGLVAMVAKWILDFIKPMPASSKIDLPLAKAEPISDGGNTTGITY